MNATQKEILKKEAIKDLELIVEGMNYIISTCHQIKLGKRYNPITNKMEKHDLTRLKRTLRFISYMELPTANKDFFNEKIELLKEAHELLEGI
jgi:hypothetical protein